MTVFQMDDVSTALQKTSAVASAIIMFLQFITDCMLEHFTNIYIHTNTKIPI